MNKLVIAISVCWAGTLVWAASGYNVNLPKAAVVGGTELKPGDYRLVLNGDRATLKHGKTSIEADVTVENGPTKFQQTSACCLGEDGKYRLQEIRVGGTNTKVLFKPDSGVVAGK